MNVHMVGMITFGSSEQALALERKLPTTTSTFMSKFQSPTAGEVTYLEKEGMCHL